MDSTNIEVTVPQNWTNVFEDVTKACEALAAFRLDLLNDRFATVLAPSVKGILKHETNEYTAIYQLLLATSGTSTSNAVREAMVKFCRDRGTLRNLLLFHLRSPHATVLLTDRPHPAPLSAPTRQHDPVPPDPIYTHMYTPTWFNIGDTVLRFLGTIVSQGWNAASQISNRAAILASLQPERGKALVDADHDLPVLGPCFGRSSQLSTMEAMLCHSDVGRCVVLGGGGMGKSTLASKVISLPPIRARFRGRRFWIAMESLSTRADLHRKIATALGLREDADLRLICVFLLEQPTLLVIDAVERYSAAGQETLVEDLDYLGRASYIIATLKGTRPPPIQTNWTLVVLLKGLDLAAARETFLLAGTEHSSDPDLGAVLKECEGFPLVLRLMSRVPTLGQPLAFLLDRWLKEKSRLLELGTTKFDSLQVCVSLSLSHPTICSNEQAWDLLRILAGVPTGLSFPEINLLFHSSGFARVDVLWNLGLIVQTVHVHDGELRYHLLNPLRILVTDMFDCPSTSQVTNAVDTARIGSPNGVVRECGLELAADPSMFGWQLTCFSSSKTPRPLGWLHEASDAVQKNGRLKSSNRIAAVVYRDSDGNITAARTQLAIPDPLLSKICRLLGWSGSEGPFEITSPLPISQELRAPEFRWDNKVNSVLKFGSLFDHRRSSHTRRPELDNESQARESHRLPPAAFEESTIAVICHLDEEFLVEKRRHSVLCLADLKFPEHIYDRILQVPWSILPCSHGWIVGIAKLHAEFKRYDAAMDVFASLEVLPEKMYKLSTKHKKLLLFYSSLCRLCLECENSAIPEPLSIPDVNLDKWVEKVYVYAKYILWNFTPETFDRLSRLLDTAMHRKACWSGWEAELLGRASDALDTLGYVYKDRVSPVCVDAEYLLGNFRKRYAMGDVASGNRCESEISGTPASRVEQATSPSGVELAMITSSM